jgi:hypothetical protein
MYHQQPQQAHQPQTLYLSMYHHLYQSPQAMQSM